MKAGVYFGVLALATAAACTALFIIRRSNAGLEAQVTHLSRQNAALRYELKQASRQAADIGQRAVELDSQLGSSKARTTATEAANVQLARQLTEREQREVTLMAELATLRPQTSGRRPPEEPAVLPTLIITASPTPPPPPVVEFEVGPYRRRIAELEEQLTRLLTRALAETRPEPTPPVPAPHQVVRVGPAAAFVVLDYGAEHGARPQAIIRLQRGTSELAQVQISDVRPRFSLAHVLPGTLKGQLQTGDLVVFNQ